MHLAWYFKKNKDKHENNYCKITKENKWLKKLSPKKCIKQHKKRNHKGKNLLRAEEVSILIEK